MYYTRTYISYELVGSYFKTSKTALMGATTPTPITVEVLPLGLIGGPQHHSVLEPTHMVLE